MKSIRMTLRWLFQHFPIRGRHRLAKSLGKVLSSNAEETLEIGGILLPIDFTVEMYRYIYYGIYEEEFVNLLRRVIKPGDVVIEPGANIGYISAILSSLVGESGKVYALEPSAICYDKIRRYLTKPNITLLHKAIGDTDGSLDFIDTDRVIARGYSSVATFAGELEMGNKYAIPSTTVDTIAAQFGISRVRFLKLDVEGSELMALRGSIKMLSERRIDYILVETLFSDAAKAVNASVYELLSGYGYFCHKMKRNRLAPLEFFSEQGTRHDVIWTCRKYEHN